MSAETTGAVTDPRCLETIKRGDYLKNKGANRIHRRKSAKNLKLSQLQQIWYSMDAKCVLDPMAQRKRLMQFIMRNVFGGAQI